MRKRISGSGGNVRFGPTFHISGWKGFLVVIVIILAMVGIGYCHYRNSVNDVVEIAETDIEISTYDTFGNRIDSVIITAYVPVKDLKIRFDLYGENLTFIQSIEYSNIDLDTGMSKEIKFIKDIDYDEFYIVYYEYEILNALKG